LFAAVLAMALGFLLLSIMRFLWPAWVVALVAWCALGGLAASLERSSIPADNAARLVTQGQLDTSEPLRWRGQLRSDPLRLPWGLRYEIALEEVQNAAGAHPVSGGLRVNYFYNVGKRADLPPLRAGDRIEALVQARPPRNFLDPGVFDARGWLARQGIHLVGSLRSAELLTPWIRILRWLFRRRPRFTCWSSPGSTLRRWQCSSFGWGGVCACRWWPQPC
jgi:hypothetical protein